MAYAEEYITQNTNPTGYVHDFFDNNSLIPFAGTRLLATALHNQYASYYTSKGDSILVQANAGNDASRPGNASSIFRDGQPNALPVSKRWVLQGKGYITDSIGNKPLGQWTYNSQTGVSSDVETVTDYWFSAREMAILTGDAGEGGPLVYDDNPGIFTLHEKRMGEKAEARGQEYYGQYAGGLFGMGDTSLGVAALGSDSAAVTWANTQPGAGGGRSNFVPYFTAEHYKLYHLTINGYYLGSNDTFTRMYSAMGTRAAGRRALRGVGYGNRKILYYTESIENEVGAGNQGTENGQGVLYGYTAKYRRDLGPGKGFVFGFGWPPAPFGYLLFDYFDAFLMCDSVCNFMPPTGLYGTNPDVVYPYPDRRPGDNFILHDYDPNGTNYAPQAAMPRVGIENADPSQPASYPDRPMGHVNAQPEGYRLMQRLCSRVGNKSYQYPTLTVGGNTYTPNSSTDDQFLNTCLRNGLPLCKFGQNQTTGDGWVAAYWVDNRTGSDKTGYLDVTFNCNGKIDTKRLYSSIPRFFTF